ncbi:hypothetical protein PTT_13284 [Pyrenophora teres f. teres 0-1]|uniref:Uncharacterized protein n=1 Tax=Pyrenophora teres f. teres (strain 0-1) TaxID=861557 RepID=E3RVQ5_PYRTT|nr:hypothetical protein PTT_13284 [Pyrenophora teres f. teres 0-1]
MFYPKKKKEFDVSPIHSDEEAEGDYDSRRHEAFLQSLSPLNDLKPSHRQPQTHYPQSSSSSHHPPPSQLQTAPTQPKNHYYPSSSSSPPPVIPQAAPTGQLTRSSFSHRPRERSQTLLDKAATAKAPVSTPASIKLSATVNRTPSTSIYTEPTFTPSFISHIPEPSIVPESSMHRSRASSSNQPSNTLRRTRAQRERPSSSKSTNVPHLPKTPSFPTSTPNTPPPPLRNGKAPAYNTTNTPKALDFTAFVRDAASIPSLPVPAHPDSLKKGKGKGKAPASNTPTLSKAPSFGTFWLRSSINFLSHQNITASTSAYKIHTFTQTNRSATLPTHPQRSRSGIDLLSHRPTTTSPSTYQINPFSFSQTHRITTTTSRPPSLSPSPQWTQSGFYL